MMMLQHHGSNRQGRMQGSRIYGAGDMAKRYKPGVSCVTQQSRASPYGSQVSTHSSVEIAAQMAAIEERANAAEHDARAAREDFRKANERTQDLERQLRKLAESVTSIKRDQPRRHPDYEEGDSDSKDDSVYNIDD